MWGLYEQTAYEERFHLASFDLKEDAETAATFLNDQASRIHGEGRDYGYIAMKIQATSLKDFLELYDTSPKEELVEENRYLKSTFGGDDCYTGRRVQQSKPESDDSAFHHSHQFPVV